MEITNKYQLPEGLVEIVSGMSYPPNPKRFSVTDIIGPPLIRSLKIDHWKELETDVSDYLWMILGVAVDDLISSAKKGEAVRQHKMELEIDGHTVVGKADVINDDVLADWKCTSVYSFIGGIKPEWEGQLNIYDYLLWKELKEDSPITSLKIYAILRDWQASKAKYDKNYPNIPFQISTVSKWTHEQQRDYILSRLNDYIKNPYRECTDDEKWRSDTTYAVKKNGQKRAMRVLESFEKAEEWKNKNGGNYIEKRLGECKRCSTYCAVKSICKYAKGI